MFVKQILASSSSFVSLIHHLLPILANLSGLCDIHLHRTQKPVTTQQVHCSSVLDPAPGMDPDQHDHDYLSPNTTYPTHGRENFTNDANLNAHEPVFLPPSHLHPYSFMDRSIHPILAIGQLMSTL